VAEQLQRTPIHEAHVQLGAKLVPFAGYEMPVQYPAGILEEHRAVRTAAGLFDVSHMGEIDVRGPGALDLVQQVTTNDASTLAIGQAQYTVMCREDGGALDDCIVYRLEDRWMIVVNAANRAKDAAWIAAAAADHDVAVEDRSDSIALLALQGPRAQELLAQLTAVDLDAIRYYHFVEGGVDGAPSIISRTGYTGEDGFELYVPAEAGADVWLAILEVGRSAGIRPVGLGARDSLRLEMGYALYGNDLDESHNPLEAGLGWVVKLDKGDFFGRDALARVKEEGVRERLVGFRLSERGFPRHGYELRHAGEPVGEVTSGILSPSLQQGIGLGYVATEAAKKGSTLDVVIRGRDVPGEVVRPPFYTAGSVRK
jgi:aminomethyltransferase